MADEEPPVRALHLTSPALFFVTIAWTDSRPQASAIRFQSSDPRVLGTLQDPKLLLHQNRQMAHRLEETA